MADEPARHEVRLARQLDRTAVHGVAEARPPEDDRCRTLARRGGRAGRSRARGRSSRAPGCGPVDDEPVDLRLARNSKRTVTGCMRQALGQQERVDCLHQIGRIAVVLAQLDPVLGPDAELIQDGLELAAGLRRVVFPAAASAIRAGARSRRRPRGSASRWTSRLCEIAPDAVLDLAEVVPVEQHDLAQDQRRPAFGEHLAREGHRADLLVLHGAASMRAASANGQADFARATPRLSLATGRRPRRRTKPRQPWSRRSGRSRS